MDKGPIEEFLERIAGTFLDDLGRADKLAKASGSQFDRKNYVRAFFAYVEGSTAGWKDSALTAHQAGRVRLTPAELAIAREESYELNEKGEAEVRKKLIRTADNALFGLRMWARSLGVILDPDRKSPGWQAFLQALRIRDRITHPKSLEESRIADDDFATVLRAHDWFTAQTQVIVDDFRERHDPSFKRTASE